MTGGAGGLLEGGGGERCIEVFDVGANVCAGAVKRLPVSHVGRWCSQQMVTHVRACLQVGLCRTVGDVIIHGFVKSLQKLRDH